MAKVWGFPVRLLELDHLIHNEKSPRPEMPNPCGAAGWGTELHCMAVSTSGIVGTVVASVYGSSKGA